MKKITFGMIIITIILFFGLTISSNPLSAKEEVDYNQKREIYLNIYTVTKGQYQMIKDLVGDKHSVEYLCEDKEAVDLLKLSDNIIDNISNMDLFIYNGLNYEPWIDEMLTKLNKNNLGIIDTSRGITSLNSKDEEGNVVKLNNYNIGFNEYKIALYNMKTAIQDRDPKNREIYEKNYNNAIDELYKKITPFSKIINENKDVTFLLTTDKLDYLFNNYYMNVVKVDKKSVLDYIEKNSLDLNKTIVVSEVKGDNLPNEIILERENKSTSYNDLIINNTKKIAETIEKVKNIKDVQ